MQKSTSQIHTSPTLSESIPPLVSVVITCYNHEKYIEKSVFSVINQTYQNIELIVVNDGSTDNSEKILNSLASTHKFHVIHQQNTGLSGATNTGLQAATGKYIALLDSDDLFLPDKLDKQVAFLESHPDIAICGGNMIIINDNEELSAPRRFPTYRELGFDDIFLERLDVIPASSAMIRKEVIDKTGGFDTTLRLIQDRYFWLKATAAGFKIAGMKDLLIYYRKHDTNIHNNHQAMTENLLQILQQYADHPLYEKVKYRTMVSMFLKTSKKDKHFARKLLKEIPVKAYNLKVMRGIIRLLFI